MTKIGPLAVSVSGPKLLPEECKLIAHPAVGMVVLFKENWDTTIPADLAKAALKNLIQTIRHLNGNILISIDHEGGSVWRFEQGFTKLPSAKSLGDFYDTDQSSNKEVALQAAFNHGQIMASELLECGIDLSLAPVLDIHTPQSRIIGQRERAFHSDPKVVAIIATAFIQGMNSAGMPGTGKHFPGHGFCELDSHLAQPIDNRSFQELQKDFYPFKNLLSQNLLGAVMPAHVLYPAVHADQPASFSRIWLQDILRYQLGAENICIISDCLNMKGAGENSVLARLRAALEAGCDFLVLTHQHDKLLKNLLKILQYIPDTAEAGARREQLAIKIKRTNTSDIHRAPKTVRFSTTVMDKSTISTNPDWINWNEATEKEHKRTCCSIS